MKKNDLTIQVFEKDKNGQKSRLEFANNQEKAECLEYNCKIGEVFITYSIKKLSSLANFHIFHKTTLIGVLSKKIECWEQISGRDLGDEIINKLGKYIDNHGRI